MIRLSAFRLTPANQARSFPANAMFITASYILPHKAMPIAEAIGAVAIDLSPKVHPAMSGILFSFEPVRLGDATGRGAEPSTQRSVPSCCIADAVSLA